MCGYIRRVTDNPDVLKLMEKLGLKGFDAPLSDDAVEHYYPAFGGVASRQIRGLSIRNADGIRSIDATWWFDCEPDGDSLKVGKRTTFNARNLTSPYWKGALRHHRGVVVATGLGESKYTDGRKHQYLMTSHKPFLLGALYRPFPNGLYSCAIITRDSHPRFDRYHDKAFPLFLPAEKDFIELWLDPAVLSDPVIDDLLDHPRLYPDLLVTEVKTFKSGVAIGETAVLEADQAP